MKSWIVPIVLLFCVASLPAHAGYRVCAKRKLTTADEKALRPEIAKTAGGREVQWPLDLVCANQGNASATVNLKPEPQPDGSTLNFVVGCDRDEREWACELRTSRRARIQVNLDGRQTTFDLQLPMGFDVQRVKPLLMSAHEIGTKTTLEQQCDYEPQGKPNAHANDWLIQSHEAFHFTAKEYAGEIEESDGSIELDMGATEVLRFTQDPADFDAVTFRCWTFYIIVT